MRPSPLILVAALTIGVPCAVQSQIDTSVAFSTRNPKAASEVRTGLWEMMYASSFSASTHFAAAMKADSSFGLARILWVLQAQLPARQRDAETARAIADAAKATDAELIMTVAIAEFARGRPEIGAALYRAVAQLLPSDRFAEYVPTVGLAPDVRRVARRDFVTRHPEFALAYNDITFDNWFAGDKDGALAAARKQVELEPKGSNTHDSYAHILQWTGNFPEAVAEYNKAVSLTPAYVDSYSGLAEISALQGRFDEARDYLNKAVSHAYTPYEKLRYMKEIAGSYALEGTSLDNLVKQLEAVAAEAKAQGRPDDAAEAYAQIAATYATVGNTEASHRYIAMAKTANTADAWPAHYYSLMGHGLLKHWGPANDELRALKAFSGDAAAPQTRVAAAEGYLLTQQGKPADALKILMATDTTNYIVINRIADAHAALGHAAEAANWYGRITGNNAVNFDDFPGLNARRRAKEATAAVHK